MTHKPPPPRQKTTYSPEDIPNLQDMAHVSAIRKPAADIALLSLRIDNPELVAGYKAGQYVFVGFDDFPPRPYSIASSTPPDQWEIHIKNTGTKGASAHAINNLRTNETVRISAPQGHSVFPGLDNSKPKGLLLMAGGMGIAPLKAILEEALAKHAPLPVTLLWGAADESGLYLNTYFEELAATHSHFTYQSITGAPVTDLLTTLPHGLTGYDIYLGGPPAMLTVACKKLESLGVPQSRIFYDTP